MDLKQSVLSWWNKEGFTLLGGKKPEFVKLAEEEPKGGYFVGFDFEETLKDAIEGQKPTEYTIPRIELTTGGYIPIVKKK